MYSEFRAAVALVALLLASPQLLAAGEGDVASGQSGSAVCAACHGPDGNSVMPQWPSLAGQHAAYLERQIKLIKSGARPVPEMVALVAGLSEAEIRNLAAYYSAQDRNVGIADESLVAAGSLIYQAGNSETGVPACMACHGPIGEGNPLAGYPALSGQQPVYTANLLRRFREGEHWGEDDGPSIVMTGVAARLTDGEIEAVSSYIHGLHKAE